jgi:hypothetical protein
MHTLTVLREPLKGIPEAARRVSAHGNNHCFVYNTIPETIVMNLVIEGISPVYGKRCYDAVPICEVARS